MKKYLKINKQLILREDDKMLFSAKDMKIYKFNDDSYKIIKYIIDRGNITEEEIITHFKDKYDLTSINYIIKKMIENSVIYESNE